MRILPLLSLLLTASFVQAKGTLEVYWVDVEGGAATLVVTPAGESLLVDTGNPGTNEQYIYFLRHNMSPDIRCPLGGH